MKKTRKSFVLHIDSLDMLDELTNEQAGLLFKAIKAYQKDEELKLDNLTKIAFSPFKNQFIRDGEKYVKTCERRAIAGAKGGKQKVANASKCKQSVANLAESVSKSDSKSKNKSDSKEISNRRFTPPSLNEVTQYCTERCNLVDPQAFIDHYTSNGWMRGKTKIKDWKACVRTWEKNSTQTQAKQYSDVTAQNIKNLQGGW